MAELSLPQLPDTRSTQRLLNILRQLEDHIADGATFSGQPLAVAGEVRGELARLRRENKELKTRQKVARQRVEDLLSRLKSQQAPVTQQIEDGLLRESAA